VVGGGAGKGNKDKSLGLFYSKKEYTGVDNRGRGCVQGGR